MKIKQKMKDIKITQEGDKYFIENVSVQELTKEEFKTFKNNTANDLLFYENMVRNASLQSKLTPKIEDEELAILTEIQVKALKNAERMIATEKAKEDLFNAKTKYGLFLKYKKALDNMKD